MTNTSPADTPMSKRPVEPVFRLSFTADGKAELLRDGETLWASDDDPDFADEFGDDALTPNNELRETDIGEIIRYLVNESVLTHNQAAEMDVDIPETVNVIEDDDDDELDPTWDEEDDDDTDTDV